MEVKSYRAAQQSLLTEYSIQKLKRRKSDTGTAFQSCQNLSGEEANSITAVWLCPDTTWSDVTTSSQGDNLTQRQEHWTTDQHCSNTLKIKVDI